MNKKVLLWIIFAAIFAFLVFYIRSNGLNSGETTLNILPTETPLGGDRDEHGCIPSAGYSWCEEKQKCLRLWEESCSTVTPTPYNEIELLLKGEIKQLLIEKHGKQAENLEVKVSNIAGNYAKGSASQAGLGGGMWFAVKEENSWKLIWDGNGIITCTDVKDYPDLPVSFVPQCFDDESNEMIQRN